MLALDGSRAAFRLSPNGLRARLVRNVGGIALDLGTLEQVDVRAMAGAYTLTTDDLAGTTVQAVTANLGDADAATDRAIVNGSQFDDTIDVAGANCGATVAGVTAPAHADRRRGRTRPADRQRPRRLRPCLLAGPGGHHARAHGRRRR